MTDAERSPSLAVLCRVASRFCAFPLEHVIETMRPLPLEPLAAMPAYVMGISVIRGSPTPVVHAGRVLGAVETQAPTRFVVVKAGSRCVALAVDAVVGVRDLAARSIVELPPLLGEGSSSAVAAIGTLDSELLLLLRSARLVPDPVWTALEAERSR